MHYTPEGAEALNALLLVVQGEAENVLKSMLPEFSPRAVAATAAPATAASDHDVDADANGDGADADGEKKPKKTQQETEEHRPAPTVKASSFYGARSKTRASAPTNEQRADSTAKRTAAQATAAASAPKSPKARVSKRLGRPVHTSPAVNSPRVNDSIDSPAAKRNKAGTSTGTGTGTHASPAPASGDAYDFDVADTPSPAQTTPRAFRRTARKGLQLRGGRQRTKATHADLFSDLA
ncbi:hypothetical protein PTSG_08261 [Salpingoeca rosetta]|uniref:Uncharacterized protein n=1 Tax=Salpingoeca rosetta (strain ATCC 50818 / BSB-021) TaxID=946362 RepID=F2UIG7_SALR5|nr:uncharacterized protein PTSG_08261 [Salpingoeca rosetta]EGD76916.1 hypothetical protein PTSG_08261 [Salpingoeca rosetta]|eukprot:XP_004991287.1 hypothetical protein PTSG_08261 [Salpingoeca rosetta]